MKYNITERLESIRKKVMKENKPNLNILASAVKRKLNELADKFYRSYGKEIYDLQDIKAFKVRVEDGLVRVYTDSIAFKLFHTPYYSDNKQVFEKYQDEFERWCKTQKLNINYDYHGIIDLIYKG